MRTLPIFLAFFLMGLADAMGPMSDAVKKEYGISNVISTLLPFFVFIAFAVFSVPGGLLAARIGKKKLLLLGLGLNAAALVVPSLQVPNFYVLLGCIFLLGVGTTFLQVSGNPIMRDVSAPGSYSRNLSFAQGIKGIGSTASTWLVTALAAIPVFKSMAWRGAFPLFFVLMSVAFVGVLLVKVEETKADEPPSIASSLGLLKEPIFFLAVLGIFLYVGAEQSMTRFLKPTLEAFGLDEQNGQQIRPRALLPPPDHRPSHGRRPPHDHRAPATASACPRSLVWRALLPSRLAPRPSPSSASSPPAWASPISGPCSFRLPSKNGRSAQTN